MRWLVLLFGLLALLPIPTAASETPDAPTWYPLAQVSTEAAARVEKATLVPGGIDLRVRVPGLFGRTIETPAGPRGVLTIPEGGLTAEPGHPRLPVLRTLVEVPPGASIDLEIEIGSIHRLPLEQLGIDARLLSVQPPVPSIEGAGEQSSYVEDPSAYALDRYLPDASVEVVDRAVLRGRHVALIELRPVRYRPAAGTVEVWSDALLKVRFAGGKPEVALREAGRLASYPMDRWLARQIEGLEPPGRAASVPTAGGATDGALGMLVIAADDYVDALQPFLDWKKQTGYKIELLRISDIGTDPTDSDLRWEVLLRYSSWSGPALDFLLLVGDTHVVPIHLGDGGGESQVTDNWYACLDGSDFLPEIAVARISTRSAQETADVVHKLLTYEQATFPGDDWIKDCGFIGTRDSWFIDMVEGTHDDNIDDYYIPNFYRASPWSHGYEACDRHYFTTGATTSQIADSIDAGRSMINYTGHGGTTYWQGPTLDGRYDANDVRGNTNVGMYPFVIGNACDTGALDVDECLAETWQKVPNAGAIAYWGASNLTYWSVGDVLQRGLQGAIFPMDETPPVGLLVNEAKLHLYSHWGSQETTAYYFDMYNLLSEPSLSLWTRYPRPLDVVYPPVVPVGHSSIRVTVTHLGQPMEGALVALLKADETVFEAGHTGSSGSVELMLDPAPAGAGTMLVTVTGHDLDPYEGSLEVLPEDSPWLGYLLHAVDDSSGGNGDGLANPGEELLFAVTLENVGGLPASGVAAGLSTSTPQWAEVLDGSAVFPDLAPGEQGTSMGDHYRIRVKPETPDGARLGFDLSWSLDGDALGVVSFSEAIVAVNLEPDGYSIDDSLLGDGDGFAEAGEAVDLELTLANIGQRAASGISGVLSSASSYLTVLQPMAVFADIPAGGSGSSQAPHYRVAVDPWVPYQESVTAMLTLTEQGSGHIEVIPYELLLASADITPSVDVPKPIEDNATIESELFCPYSVPIDDIGVFVDISHTNKGNLSVILLSPAGTTCLLHNRNGGPDDDIVTWYDEETQPVQPLSAFHGEDAFGTWRLMVTDHAVGDVGTLDGWELMVFGQSADPAALLMLSGREVDDAAACDPDGTADVGETVRFELTVRNAGTAPATGVRITLSAPETLALSNDTVLLPDLAPDAEAVALFDVATGAVGCLEQADIVIGMQANEGQWFDGFALMLEADKDGESFEQDLELSGMHPPGWTHSAAQGTDDWSVVSTNNHTPGGSWSWFSSAAPSIKDDRLISPQYVLASHSSLEFWHWIDMQSGFDGGVLEITQDNGLTWTDLGGQITFGGYDRRLSGTSPLTRRAAWTGAFPEWRRVLVDLAPWGDGPPVQLRWRLLCDDAIAGGGWWIDDVVIHSEEAVCDAHPCGIPGEVRLTSLSRDTGSVTLAWAADPLCLDYRVWRSADPTQAASFADVTAEDVDPTDAEFLDGSVEPLSYWIIQGRGPDGNGPWGHYEQ